MAEFERDIVFISYSHRAPEWRDRLLVFLKPWIRAGRLDVWADPYIKTGDQWLREIDEKLARTSVGVLLISQDYLASDFVADVELPALIAAADRGEATLVCIPVGASNLGSADLDRSLPEAELLRFQWPRPPGMPMATLDDADREQALVEVTDEIVQAAGASQRHHEGAPVASHGPRPVEALPADAVGAEPGELQGVPEQKPNYVERTKELRSIREALIGGRHAAVGISGAAPRVGLQGRGGMGKSVLAIALANDPAVRRAFPGGIFWVTVGQQPNVTSFQTTMARHLGEPNPVITDPLQGRALLRDLWADRVGLVIIDDLWAREHAMAFEITNPASRILITTRDGTLLTALGAHDETIEALDPELALRLLANWVRVDRSELPPLAAVVAEECGFLPLTLSVAGAMIRDGSPWEDLLEALRAGKVRFLDHPSGNVFASMRLSIDFLDPPTRDRYLELVVFPEDTDIPEATVCQLWRSTARLAGYECRRLLGDLARKGLLYIENGDDHRRAAPRSRKRQWRVTFHDLQHDFLRLVAEDVPQLHQRLVSAYLGEVGHCG